MDIGILVNLKTNTTSAGDITLSLTGLVENPTYGPTAQDAQEIGLSVETSLPQMPSLTYQWCTAEAGEIAGETAPTFTADASVYDQQNLFCRVVTDDGVILSSNSSIIRHAAPTVLAAPSDMIFDEDSGPQTIDVTGIFSGEELSYAFSGDGATFDPILAQIIVETDQTLTSSQLTLQATNSGGVETVAFNITVETNEVSSMTIYVDALSAAGAGEVPVSGTAIVSGDPNGHWQIINQMLSPSAAGDAADMNQGPYTLVLDDASEVEAIITQQISATDWALSSPTQSSFDIVIFNVPAGTSDLQTSINGGPWNSLGTNTPGLYQINGLDPNSAYRVALRAFNGAGSQPSSKSIATVPEDPRGFRGWNPTIDLGTTGNLYVAPYGDDSATGTQAAPLRTITAAAAQAQPGDVVKIRAGKYREEILLGQEITLEGYGTEKPEITAAELIHGFVQCDVADAVTLGSVLGAASSPVFKTTLQKADIEHGTILALNLYEAGQRLFPATDRSDVSDLFNDLNQETFHTADVFNQNGNGEILSITDPDIITSSRYSEQQLLAADVLMFHFPSVIARVSITNVDFSTGTIDVSDLKTAQINGDDTRKYALTNIAPSLQPGTYFIRDLGAEVEVFVWPHNPANIDQIEFSARSKVINLDTSAQSVGLHGLHVSRASGANSGDGINIYKGDINNRTDNHSIQHVLSSGNFNATTSARSIRLNYTANTVLRRITFYDLMNGVGLFLNGGIIEKDGATITGLHPGEKNLLEQCLFDTIGRTPFVAYHQFDLVFAHNLARKASLAAHANKTNTYEQCHNVLWWGNEFGLQVQGYLTWQEASAVTVAWNCLPVYWPEGNDQRAIADQTNTTPAPFANTNGHIFNNIVLPQIGNNNAGVSVSLANTLSDISMQVANNIVDSITAPARANPAYDLFTSNAILRLGYDGATQSSGDFDMTSNVLAQDLTQTFTDAAAGDFSFVPGSPVLDLIGHDMQAVVAQLATTYPHFTGFDRDYKNQLIDWAMLPVGADSAAPFSRAPVLSDPQGQNIDATSASGAITTSLPGGTLYAGLWDSTTAPTAAQIEAGTGSVFHATLTDPAAGQHGFTAENLTSGSTLTWHFLHKTTFGDSVFTGVEITLASGGPTGPNLVPDPGFDDSTVWNIPAGHFVDNGVLTITNASVNFSSTSMRPDAAIQAAENQTYEFRFDVVSVTSAGRLRIHVSEMQNGASLGVLTPFDTNASGALTAGSQVVFQITTQAGVNEMTLGFNRVTGVDAVFDNLSCHLVT